LATLTSDTCSGCHRAHTASGPYLINASTEEELCLSCHGDASTGATTNVEDGLQYAVGTTQVRGAAPAAGALRSGGFVNASIDSGHVSRLSYPYWDPTTGTYMTSFSSKVAVLAAPAPVTSAHLDLDGPGGVISHGKAWGNGALGSGAGPVVSLGCTGCHNPHGNGQYRILNKIPTAAGTGFVSAPTEALVTDMPLPDGAGNLGTRNYTIKNGLTLDDVTGGSTDGDYWRKFIPWNTVPQWDGSGASDVIAAGGHEGDVPMYMPGAANLEYFETQISAWCTACHTRYLVSDGASKINSGDPIFTYRHLTTTVACTQCHVAHGSNAAMPGVFSGPMTYPDGSAATSVTVGPVTTYLNSKLLKIDNRGTCQACHDPTGTIPFDGNLISH
jgi:predicted CXXCH cytochrome family protein